MLSGLSAEHNPPLCAAEPKEFTMAFKRSWRRRRRLYFGRGARRLRRRFRKVSKSRGLNRYGGILR